MNRVFRAYLLALYLAGKDTMPPSRHIIFDGAPEYEVERVLVHRSQGSERENVHDYLF